MFLKFISIFYTIKFNFRYLPREIQSELVDTLEEFSELCILSKQMKKKGEN